MLHEFSWRRELKESHQCDYRALSLVPGAGYWDKAAMLHVTRQTTDLLRHSVHDIIDTLRPLLSMVVLPGGQNKQANTPLTCTHTQRHTHRKRKKTQNTGFVEQNNIFADLFYNTYYERTLYYNVNKINVFEIKEKKLKCPPYEFI